MLPVIAIIGRPNVGKSTLFNYLTKSRKAIVTDIPGVTRDRQFGTVMIGSQRILVIDTGGLVYSKKSTVESLSEIQAKQAIKESSHILFVVDAKTGLTTSDEMIANQLHKKNRKVFLVINKIDANRLKSVKNEFYRLGFHEFYVISAKRGSGINALINKISNELMLLKQNSVEKVQSTIKMAIIGQQNVGKSTLINQLLGKERVIACNQPGTTRDSIYIPYIRESKNYTLIDTAGIRRKVKICDLVEKLSVIKSIQTMHVADVVIFMLDANNSVCTQDLRLLNLIIKIGTPMVIAINKWDCLENNKRETVQKDINQKISFVDFACVHFISALKGKGIRQLFQTIDKIYQSVWQKLTSNQLTKALETAVLEHAPPLVKGNRRVRLQYAHLGNRHPLTIVIHGKNIKFLSQPYFRYLSNFFRKTFNFIGMPIHIKLKSAVSRSTSTFNFG
ncbi:ribosome biogenesis GTPase Der [Coxiella endosymbiont of Amblyomma americanum]|uniref:ribosome biogenesis GTPase Der n=1 Tax=Coxiella endosymbiont of Amblyomma americanum TaxID=325775 RepID=UPI000580201B|nr:ribosome biogenesis GTPase Der [Coxiella endosymbiont of Amblyomma americanum]AJC50521.1 GTPase Der [Coxiella endosymbiont of Amblyomma americanum]AUJ58856.1 ribosome biogenesis GTPase Der [Coxiella-like endosymbiont of Amblyomma americanum]